MNASPDSALRGRVLFGVDTIKALPDELARLAGKRALIICTPQQQDQAEQVRNLLGDSAAAIFSGATMHTPVDVTAEAMRIVADKQIDCIVAIGGGFFLIEQWSAQRYYEELTQRLNAPIAMYVTQQRQLITNGQPDLDSLRELAAPDRFGGLLEPFLDVAQGGDQVRVDREQRVLERSL